MHDNDEDSNGTLRILIILITAKTSVHPHTCSKVNVVFLYMARTLLQHTSSVSTQNNSNIYQNTTLYVSNKHGHAVVRCFAMLEPGWTFD